MKKIMFNDKYGLTNAVFASIKTQTRRIIKDKKLDYFISRFGEDRISLVYSHSRIGGFVFFQIVVDGEKVVCSIEPKYRLGEVVAVAQSYKSIFNEDCRRSKEGKTMFNICINNACDQPGWTNKMFVRAELMPHHIRITDVKVERLQDISDEDCIKEGIFMDGGDDSYVPRYFYDYPNNRGDGFDTPREAYASLIDKVSGKGTFESNPYVFVYEFELVD